MKSILSAPSGARKRLRAASKAKALPKCPIQLRLGDQAKPVKLDASALDDAALTDIIGQAAKHCGKAMTLTAKDAAVWPAAARTKLWSLWRGLTESGARVTFQAGGKKYTMPGAFAADRLKASHADPQQTCDALDLAAEMIVGCHKPADHGIFADEIINSIRKLTKERRAKLAASLTKRLKASGSASQKLGGAATENVPAFDLARAFLDQRYPLKEKTPVDDDEDDDPPLFDTEEEPRKSYSLRLYAEEFYVRHPGVWVPTSASDIRTEVTSFLQSIIPDKVGIRRVNDVLENLRGLCPLYKDRTPPLPFFLDKERRFLALKNGLIDLDVLAAKDGKAKLLPHDARWFSASILPYRYEAKAACPLFLRFLREVLDADLDTGEPKRAGDNRIAVIQEAFGYCLLPNASFQKFFVWTGKGQNGKGVLSRLLRLMLGAENVSNIGMDALGHRFGLAPLLGKLANISGDLNDIDNVAEGVLKQLTGEDVLTIDRKHRSTIELVPTFKLFFLCNEMPRFRDKSSGIWRRLIVIPFTYQVSKVDAQLTNKLAVELPGILNWAIAGLQRLLKQGQFSPCQTCADAAADHRHYLDPVAQFVEEYCSLAKDHPEAPAGVFKVLKWRLYECYAQWAKDSGMAPLYKATFGHRIAQFPGVAEWRGKAEHDSKRPEHWKGIRIGSPDTARYDPPPPPPSIKRNGTAIAGKNGTAKSCKPTTAPHSKNGFVATQRPKSQG